jgi:hypothetical protein
VKTLTVRQPWAWAIARGHKNVENRGWSTTHRGPLAVHAALRWDDEGEDALRFVCETVKAGGGTLPDTFSDDHPYTAVGLVLAVVDLADVCTDSQHQHFAAYELACHCGPWAQPGQAHWKLTNARPLDAPFKARGRLSLWDCEVPDA